LRRWQASIRQIVETVHDRLLATFGLDHERPHGLSGFRTRLDADCLQHDGLLTSSFNGRAWWFTGQIMGMTVTNLVPLAEGGSAEEAAINALLMRHQR
jgi:hypothetical protein